MVIGLIGGSGMEGLFEGVSMDVNTPYGAIKAYKKGFKNVTVYFIPRHGVKHENPPHRVNYRGNLYALASLGVDKIVATGAVGSLNDRIPPGSLVLVDQFIDFTKRSVTFYEDVIVHVDMTRPYCESINRILLKKGHELNIPIRYGGVYVCTEGPRFETPAEINMFKALGADVVGMTNVPEVVLARELGVHYSLISIVTNYAAGMQERVSHEEVLRIMERIGGRVKELIMESIEDIDSLRVDDECTRYRKYALKYILKGI